MNIYKPARQCLAQYMQSKWLCGNEYIQEAGINLHLSNILTFPYLLRSYEAFYLHSPKTVHTLASFIHRDKC